MRLIFLLMVCLWSSVGFAQNLISGKVTDAATGKPIAFASVFFANTTFGSSTNENGEYRFSGFPSGKYDLTFSYVGYTTAQISIAFEGSQHEVNQRLELEARKLNDITVKPDTAGWKQNYEQFKKHFLGNSQYARQCSILNPKDITPFYDSRDGVLVAYSKNPIVIENRATGYRIKYYLHQFEYQSYSGVLQIYGLPQFEEMEARNSRIKSKWQEERKRIYEGSLLHFMRSWRDHAWVAEGFTVARAYRVPNRNRPPEKWLNKKIGEHRKRAVSKGMPIVLHADGRIQNGDSLSYFMRLNNLPKEVDSVLNESLSGKEFEDALENKNFKGQLKVKFKRLEDLEYARDVAGRAQRLKQESLLTVYQPIKVYSNGYYEDIRSIFIEKYWSWSEKMATLLPLDYIPE